MSRYGHNSDARQGERDFECNGRYGYDERRYGNNRDYQDGFDEARRADDRRREAEEAEEAAGKQAEYRAEYRAAQCRREQEDEEQEDEEQEDGKKQHFKP